MLRRFAILLGWMAVIWGCGVFLRLHPEWTRSVFRPGAVGLILGFSFLAIGETIRRSSVRQHRARAALWLIVAVGIMVMLSRSAFVKTMIDGRALIAGNMAATAGYSTLATLTQPSVVRAIASRTRGLGSLHALQVMCSASQRIMAMKMPTNERPIWPR